MIIKSITMQNFKKFEKLTVEFNSMMNVIVGSNGAGKSSILEALAVGAGSFFLGIEGISSPGIKEADVRFVAQPVGSVIDRYPQYPVFISCTGVIDSQPIEWVRSLNTETSKTTVKEAAELKRVAQEKYLSVRMGISDIVFPMISYYGTGRLWSQKKEKQDKTKRKLSNRFAGYVDSLSSSSNEKMMINWFKKMTYQRLQDGVELPELTAVENAVAECFIDSGISAESVKVRYSIKSEEIEIVYKDDNDDWQKHPFHELSDGFRNTLSLVADIAYRMAVLNPQLLENVTKETPGIVIIDEIDQHLHPQWQRVILKSLTKIFPKIQFIVSTHSPSVIASAQKKQLILLNEYGCSYPDYSFGKDSNSVLSEIMEVYPRPDEVQVKLDAFNQLLDEENFDKAKDILNELAEMLGDDNSDVVSARIALDFETC